MTQHVPTDWIVDSGAIHHINNDLDNLHITNSYHGQDKLIVGDGIALPIAHIDNTILHTHHVFFVTMLVQLIYVQTMCFTSI